MTLWTKMMRKRMNQKEKHLIFKEKLGNQRKLEKRNDMIRQSAINIVENKKSSQVSAKVTYSL